jgi:hypothetical protein
VFDGIYVCPQVLAVARHVLGRPFKVFSLNARSALAGQGHQALHADAPGRPAGERRYDGYSCRTAAMA